jgi:MoaA/NifB/PqqE/SkfB family radical SAM enzyme
MVAQGREISRQGVEAWRSKFRQYALQKRIPLSATLELTSRCNLRCQHCYLGEQDGVHARFEEERTTEEVKASLEEWATAGTLYLTLTGGDPMMRPDFAAIYLHAAGLGMVITVFCNGTLVSDEIVQLFQEFPPRGVEISVYGATARTYDAVTQSEGSFEKAWRGIRKLHAAGVRLVLKTMVLKINECEVEEMVAQADELGCAFRLDAAIFPCMGDLTTDPLSLRVSPERAVELDVAMDKRRVGWERRIAKFRTRDPDEHVYACGAGRTGFCADPYGYVQPCLIATKYRYDLAGRRFDDVWSGELAEICDRKRTRPASELETVMSGACSHCPAMNYLETGDEEVPSDYLERTARLRYARLVNADEGV